jgi:TRAP transporter 4TM/12TM fusion protein
MPPVMGAAAFVMSEFTGIPYVTIMLAAIIPALLYYLGVGFQVHFEAVRLGLRGTAREQLPPFWHTLFRGFHYFVPIVAIFYLLLSGYTPLYAGLWALILVVAVTSFRKASRLNWPRLKEALEASAKAAVGVAIATAGAGIVIGVVTLTGLGLRFSSFVVDMAGGQLFPALVLTMIVAIVLGMGLPPVAAYLIQAALLAPTLVQLGVPVLAAHLFCFYFAIVSNITPPVALAAYAGATVAGSDPFRTALTAMRLGIAAYIVPFMFVYGPALILMGTPLEIGVAFVTASAGMYSLAIASEGYYMRRITLPERVLFGAAAITLVQANVVTDLVGLGLMGTAIALHRIAAARATPVASADDVELKA